jgi:hypothetical protein
MMKRLLRYTALFALAFAGTAFAQTDVNPPRDSGSITVIAPAPPENDLESGGVSAGTPPSSAPTQERITGVRIRSVSNITGNNFLDSDDPTGDGSGTGSGSGGGLSACLGTFTMSEILSDFFQLSLQIPVSGSRCSPQVNGNALIVGFDATRLSAAKVDVGPDVLAADWTRIDGGAISNPENTPISVTLRSTTGATIDATVEVLTTSTTARLRVTALTRR